MAVLLLPMLPTLICTAQFHWVFRSSGVAAFRTPGDNQALVGAGPQ